MSFENIQWIYVTIAAPLLGALGGWLHVSFRAFLARKRTQRARIRWLCGYPADMKTVLTTFYEHGSHTLRGDPNDSAIRQLVKGHVLIEGAACGPYAEVQRYLSVHPDFWEILDKWVGHDLTAQSIISSRIQREGLTE